MDVVEKQRQRTPGDAEVLAWRARLLLWSGHVDEAEQAWQRVLELAPADPDDWLGLAGVYSRQGDAKKQLAALDRAEQLDPKRADVRIARAHALLATGNANDAKAEFAEVLKLDPANTDAKAGLQAMRPAPKHELLIGTETDFFNFAGAFQQNEATVLSQWTPRLRTAFGAGFYERGGVQAAKLDASVTGVSQRWGALTLGGAAAQDAGIVPRHEALFEYDRGWKLSGNQPFRALEIIYGQHWYWYSTARIWAMTGTAIVYLPREWTWSLALTGARSQFSGTGSEWTPSGTSRLGFPVVSSERHPLSGNVFFSCGTENFSQVDQIGSFASRTYGGGLRVKLSTMQDLSGYGGYQMRSQDRSHTSFGVTYGLRF